MVPRPTSLERAVGISKIGRRFCIATAIALKNSIMGSDAEVELDAQPVKTGRLL